MFRSIHTHTYSNKNQKLPFEAYPEIFLSSGWWTSPPEGSPESGCLWRKDWESLPQTWLPKSQQMPLTDAPLGRPSWEAEGCERVWGFLSAKGIRKKVGKQTVTTYAEDIFYTIKIC